MRAVHLSDLNLASRTLMVVAPSQRQAFAQGLLDAAHVADKVRKRTGRAHVQYGNGTLGGACQRHPKAKMPDWCDSEYLDCMQMVIVALAGRNSHQCV